MDITDEAARGRFREMAKDGKITCKDCMIIADELQIPTNEIATTLTEMHIKIIKCQLGCFP
jgi:LAO/AO transport system kinase